MTNPGLKNILLNSKKYVGIQFYPDKVIQALLKELPGIGWSNKYKMAVMPMTKESVDLIFNPHNALAKFD